MLTLKVALARCLVAIKGDLRLAAAEHVKNWLVGDIAHLVVMVDDVAHLIAYSAFILWHESIAVLVFGANVAVYTRPSLVTGALVAAPHRSIFAARKRSADWCVVACQL